MKKISFEDTELEYEYFRSTNKESINNISSVEDNIILIHGGIIADANIPLVTFSDILTKDYNILHYHIRGYGKSMYNLKIMAWVYYMLYGCSEYESYKTALNHMVFTPDHFLDMIQDAIDKDKLIPVLCIDDATVHFSSYLYFINLYQTSLLNATFDTLRTATNCVLVNCPDKHRLLSGLRHYDDYEITIYKKDTGSYYDRKAVGIKWYSLPDGHRKFRKAFEDYFSCFVPNKIYDEYLVRRKKYLKDVSDELKELMTRLKSKKDKQMVGENQILE